MTDLEFLKNVVKRLNSINNECAEIMRTIQMKQNELEEILSEINEYNIMLSDEGKQMLHSIKSTLPILFSVN